MGTLTALLAVVVPVFLVIGTGYATVRGGIIGRAGVDGLVKFATGIAVPVLLFRAMLDLDLGAAMRLDHLASFYLAEFACFVLAWCAARYLWKRRPGEAVAVAFCAYFSNSVLLGLPILERAYGAESLPPAFAIIAFHAPLNYLIGITAMEFLRRDGLPFLETVTRCAKTMFSNALAIGIAAGLALNLIGVTLPGPVRASVDMLAGAALPVALFGIGGVLTRYALKREASEALMVSGFSLVVHPALVWVLATQVLGTPPEFAIAAVVIAAMPVGVNGYLFAAMYDRAPGTAASSVLLATALAPLSVTLWLAFLGSANL